MNHQLTKSQENFCETMGLFGVLLSLTCLIQNFVFMTGHWFGFALIGVYLLSVISYAMLMKKHYYAVLLLIISAVLVLTIEMIVIGFLFSLVLVMLLAYLMVTLYLLYGLFIPRLLKQKHIAEKGDADEWADKI